MFFVYPEDCEKNFLTWFTSEKKFAFLTTLLVAIITHITFLTNMIMSQDGLWNSIAYAKPTMWELSLGRWGIFIADKIVNNLAIPNITGIVSILLISISAVLIVDFLKLKSKVSIILVSSIMAVSPALTSTLIYVYTSVAYCLSMLLAVLTAYLIFKNKNRILNILLAIVVFTFSLGIYQSYIGVTVGLVAIRLIRDLFDNVKIKYFFINGLLMVAVVIIGGLLYSHITQAVLNKMEIPLASYKGMDNINISNTIKSLNITIPNIYKDFKDFYFSDNIVRNDNYSRQQFYVLFFITMFILELAVIVNSKLWKNPFRVLCIIIMNLILPIALNVILLLTPDTNTYILTSAQLILVIPLATVICEMSPKKFTFLFKWASIISMFLIVFTYYLADNVSYTNLKLNYDQAYSIAMRIMDRIEETEGYSPEKTITIAGIIWENDIPYYKTSNINQYTLGTIFDSPIFHGTYAGMEGTWTRFFGTYLGARIQFCDPYSYSAIIETEEFKNMNIFPREDSVKMINNVMVVKLTNDPPKP